jgi:hypothetical protein
MSVDTIAIVLSVLVGAAGYVVQAHTARRAERAQEQQTLEMQAAEQARQREHQMTTAQIERTHKALDQCCRPVHNDIFAIAYARQTMVAQIVSKLEASHPAAVEEMMSFVTVSEQQPDGSVTSGSGNLLWTPNSPPGVTRAVGVHSLAMPSAASAMITTQDSLVILSKPYCFEMPDAILAILAAEPTGEIAAMYRGYVRHTMMPLCRRLANTLQEYSAYMALPPKDWLEKTYPEMSWRTFPNSVFVQHWFTYTLSFERSWRSGRTRTSSSSARAWRSRSAR